MANTARLNIYNFGTADFVTPGTQLGYIARVKPDEPAVVQVDAEGGDESISWAGLEALSNQIAWMLMEEGVGPGSTVLVSYPNSIEHIAANLGIWKTGACYMPTSCRSPAGDLEELMALLSPAAAFTDIEANTPGCRYGIEGLRERCAAYPTQAPPDTLANPNIINASGGSTGRPKLIKQNIPCGHNDASLDAWFKISGLDFNQTQLVAGPLFHGAPHIVAMNGLFSGGTLVLPARLCPEHLLACLAKYEVRFIQMVPTLMHRILKMPGLRKEAFSGLDALCHTGGVCSEWLKRAWLEIIPPEKLYEIYSMTEVIGQCAIRGDEWLEHQASVGRPKYGSRISIRDGEGAELGPYEVGNIYMSPPGGFFYTEYINETPLAPIGDSFRSVGDMGYVDGDGYLYFADRRSDMIVTGGENVFVAEVENALLRNPHVMDAVAVGIPDPEWGRRIHAVLETDGEVTPEELKAFLRRFLLPYKIPKTYEFVKYIRRKDSGKVARDEILKDCIMRGV